MKEHELIERILEIDPNATYEVIKENGSRHLEVSIRLDEANFKQIPILNGIYIACQATVTFTVPIN